MIREWQSIAEESRTIVRRYIYKYIYLCLYTTLVRVKRYETSVTVNIIRVKVYLRYIYTICVYSIREYGCWDISF